MSCNATITFRQDITDDLAVIRVKHDESVDFVPGQYAELAIPEPVANGEEGTKVARRAYSIASAPSQSRDELEFFIVLVNGGAVTPKLWEQSVGGRVWLNPKVKGKFTLADIPAGKDLIFVATGTGLAPFMSMIREFAENPPWRKAVVVHCTRLAKDLGYREELEERCKADPRLVYLPTVTREPEGSDWHGARGRVQPLFEPARFKELTGVTLDPNECQVMLCGNPDMILSLQDHLVGLGFKAHSKKNPGQIHYERYW